ncbi:MAG: sugar phosphate isomerase [Verrucomicrobia bacterium]|nr:MAG: sugar phosphate isomerase [Verrucomicrobiota bacterium]
MKLKIASIMVLAAMCAPFANSFAESKKEIGLQLYSVRNLIKENRDAAIKQMGDMGYTFVEAAGFGGGKFYGLAPEDFKAKCAEAGMKALSSHTRIPLSKEEIESGDFSKSLAKWDALIAAHKAAGMKYIVDPYLAVPKTLKELKVICDYYNAVGKKCKEAGLSFGYHNHSHEFKEVEGKVMLDYMLENTNPEDVFFQLDVYWATKGKVDPVDYFSRYPKRFRLLHIKDVDEVGKSGVVNFDEIFKNIGKSGCEYIIVEVEKPAKGQTIAETVKKSRDYLQNNPAVKPSYSK